MSKREFQFLMLITIILTQTISSIGGSSGNGMKSSVNLDAVIDEARGRSYFYKNMSSILNTEELEKIPDEYIKSLENVLKDWAGKVFAKISLFQRFLEEIQQIAKGYVKTYVAYIEYKESLPGTYEEFKMFFDDCQFVTEYINFISEYLHPHEAVFIVMNASKSLVQLIGEAHFLYTLKLVESDRGTYFSSKFGDLEKICKEQIELCDQIKQNQKNLVELRENLQKEMDNIRNTIELIEYALYNSAARTQFMDSESKTLKFCLTTILQYKTYLLSLTEMLPDFSIELKTERLSISKDGSALVLISIISRNFEGEVTLFADWINGVSVDGERINGKPKWVEREEFSPENLFLSFNETKTSIYTVIVSNFAICGEYRIRFTAVCGGRSHSKELKLIIGRIGSLKADLTLSPNIIEVNEAVSIEVKTFDENNTPIKDASIKGWVLKPNGEKVNLTLTHYPLASKFLGEFSDTAQVGIYKVIVEVSRLLYDPYMVSQTFTVQSFSYAENVYALEDYDFKLTSDLTYPYFLAEVTSTNGTVYSIYVRNPFTDCVGLDVLKSGRYIWRGALYAGDLRFFDSGELLIYVSKYLYSSITNSAILIIQFGTRTGRANITPTLQKVEVGSLCKFQIEIPANDRCTAYVYGDLRNLVKFEGISWDIMNDNENLSIKEFCRFETNPLPTSIAMCINVTEAIRTGDHYFWVSILKSSTSYLNDGMNPGDIFFITLTVVPKSYSIALKSNSTIGYENIGSITFNGVVCRLYPSGCTITRPTGTYIIRVNPPSGFIFEKWICKGGITVQNASAPLTLATVTSDGLLLAVLRPTLGGISGRITDSVTGQGIDSAEIYIHSIDLEYEGFISYFVKTNESGFYTITAIPSCTYSIEVIYAEGYITNNERYLYYELQKVVTLFPDSTIISNFELKPLPQLEIEPRYQIIRQGDSVSFNISLVLYQDSSWWWRLVDTYGPLTVILDPELLPQGIKCRDCCRHITAPTDVVKVVLEATEAAQCGKYVIPVIANMSDVLWMESNMTLEVVEADTYVNVVKFFNYSFHIIMNSNAYISNFEFIPSNKTLHFEASILESTVGYCNLTIPKMFLSGPFTVLIDKFEATYIFTETNMTSFIYFTFKNSGIINIVGSVLLNDNTPPMIVPLLDSEKIITTSWEKPKIYAYIIDDKSGLADSYLVYSVDGGISWSNPIKMNQISTYVYSAELNNFSEGTCLIIEIYAIDRGGNIAASPYYKFEVIPEFSLNSLVMLILILILAAISIKSANHTKVPKIENE